MTWDPSYYYGTEDNRSDEVPPLPLEENPALPASALLSPYPLGKSSAYQIRPLGTGGRGATPISGQNPSSAHSSVASDSSVYSQKSATVRQRHVFEDDIPPTPAPQHEQRKRERKSRTSVGESFILPKSAGRNTQYVAELIKNRSRRRRRSSIGILSTIYLNEEEEDGSTEQRSDPEQKLRTAPLNVRNKGKKVPPPLPLIAVTGLSDEEDSPSRYGSSENDVTETVGSVESIVLSPAGRGNGSSPRRSAGGPPEMNTTSKSAVARFFFG